MSRGHSLGALPLGYTGMRMRFGLLAGNGEKGRDEWDEAVDMTEGEGRRSRHIGFGAAERVLRFRRGGRYV